MINCIYVIAIHIDVKIVRYWSLIAVDYGDRSVVLHCLFNLGTSYYVSIVGKLRRLFLQELLLGLLGLGYLLRLLHLILDILDDDALVHLFEVVLLLLAV